MSRKIYVFDTTLRDGEQVPGAKLNLAEKLEVAQQIAKMKVDMMEVGFPSSSQGDFEAVRAISRKIGQDVWIAALGRAVEADIDCIYESIRAAENPLIHIVLGSSGVHVAKKFKKTPEQVIEMGVGAVKYASSLLPQVQYSLEDASRSEFEYLWQTIEAVVKAGATIINVPDTVGFAIPEEFGKLIYRINDRLKNLDPRVMLSVHCHNDTGLATANTLAAVKNGADKVECTINGIGERAGNTALEEVVMGISLHPAYYGGHTTVDSKKIYETSRMVSATMGLDIQVNKAITGENAFAHSSGIHQDGLLKSKDVYEIMDPQTIGAPAMEIVLTARSGRHAFMHVTKRLGFDIPEVSVAAIYQQFLTMADAKKEIYDNDVLTLLKNSGVPSSATSPELWQLLDYQLQVTGGLPVATVRLVKGEQEVVSSRSGSGVIDALYGAIMEAIGAPIELIDYRINSLSRGKGSLGKVTAQIRCDDQLFSGKAIEQDVMRASALALINAVNKMLLK
ncbi:2-isopropylmalate synthase [Acetobacterium wieringae]|uniref:2-isopropylmalate synthase n=1 Tax=Acetobacterium wieringae TaxID=52694 RepID=A0ABY6HH74_9FIRM|nr:2-isopropylmalate synthase [Acetobacterium wieringae]UYO63249.1 2-isopropylmalate synthase [Acetobacterium wieringae]VUZ23725.1 2-isopropylmalate synthase [Acetobacterium wieringae]